MECLVVQVTTSEDVIRYLGIDAAILAHVEANAEEVEAWLRRNTSRPGNSFLRSNRTSGSPE